MKRLVIPVLAGAMSLAAFQAMAADKVTLQLKWVTQAQFAGYYVAKAKGFYEAEGLDVDIKPGEFVSIMGPSGAGKSTLLHILGMHDSAWDGEYYFLEQPVHRLNPKQRAELHKTIWRIANDLRGSVDGWDFKSYVLGMLFYRFISENLTAYLNRAERASGDEQFDYAGIPDADAERGRKETVQEKGFYILPSELFANVRTRAERDFSWDAAMHGLLGLYRGALLTGAARAPRYATP